MWVWCRCDVNTICNVCGLPFSVINMLKLKSVKRKQIKHKQYIKQDKNDRKRCKMDQRWTIIKLNSDTKKKHD